MTEQITLKHPDGMPGAVADMADYWATYADQHGYKDYSATILLDDALYAIGIALDPKGYKFADGYARFKRDLRALLEQLEQEKAE